MTGAPPATGRGRAGDRSAVPAGEFERRWTALDERLLAEGFDACVVWGRGASALDGYADLLWLTNHYPWTPTVRMAPPAFLGSGHAAVVTDLRNGPTLICDSDDYRRDHVAVEDVRVCTDVAGAVGRVLHEKGVSAGRVALVADHGPLVGLYRRMCELGPPVEWVAVDQVLESLRLVKSAWELDALREAARLGQESLEAILEVAGRPGATEADAVAAGYAVCVRHGGQPLDAFVSSGPHTKQHAYHRLPSWSTRELAYGDLFTIDWSGVLDGYWFDCGRSVVVGGRPSADQRWLLTAAADAARAATMLLRPGCPAGEVFAEVRRSLGASGVDTAPAGACGPLPAPAIDPGGPADPPLFAAGYHGHGIGLFWEGPWLTEASTEPLLADTAFNVELVAGSDTTGWAKLEIEVLIDDDGVHDLMSTPLVLD